MLVADPLALLAVAALATLGLFNLAAIGDADLAWHQAIALALGTLVLLFLVRTPARRFRLVARVAYAAAVLLLLGVLLAGVEANGARRWLVLGPLVLQPSELAKLGLLLLLADVLGASERVTWRRIALALALAMAPIALTLLQPDLSTSLLLCLLTLLALVVARAPLRVIAALVGGAALAAPLALKLLRPYQSGRLHAFLSGAHHTDPTGAGWSLLQAQVALATGGVWGVANHPLHLLMAEYLPARQTDLAFSSLVEQGGFVAGVAAVAATALLGLRLLASARGARTRAGALLASGLAVLFGFEAAVSLAGNLGLLPLAGVPYPFVSYGGTTAAAHLAALGLVLSTRRDAMTRRLWMPPAWLRRRPRVLRVMAAGIVANLALLSGAAWHIVAAEGASLRQVGSAEMQRCARIAPARGAIVDRHGAVLAAVTDAWEVHGFPALLLQEPAVTAELAHLVGVSEPALLGTLRGAHDKLEVKLADVPGAVATQLQTAELDGVFVEHSARRTYPTGALLGPVLGFVGIATPADMKREPGTPLGAVVGRGGLEQQYDSYLRGVDGAQCVYVDPVGRPVAMGSHRDPIAGADVMLSLDLGLQREADKQLKQRLAGSHADLGAAILMDSHDGSILAMASEPTFDNNLYGPPLDAGALAAAARAPGHPMLEHATQVASPPGSTFKLVVAAAGVADNAIAPYDVIPTGYWFGYGNVSFHGWGYLPPQNLPQAIAWSNDVYFYKLALALGPEKIKQVASLLGAGVPTGIDLPGEDDGLVGTPDLISQAGGVWYPGNSVILGIGQGYVTATPMQVVRWSSALATGAVATPHLGLAYRAPGGQAWNRLDFPAPAPLPFAGKLAPIREGMRQAVTNGVDPEVSNLPIPAGAKTGTAEDPSTVSGDTDSWFVTTAPYTGTDVTGLVYARGGGQGYMSGEAIRQIVADYWANRPAITATPAAG